MHRDGAWARLPSLGGRVELSSRTVIEDDYFDEWLERAELVPVGDWHAHPGVSDTKPSQADVRGWAAEREVFGISRYTSLIVVPDDEIGWMCPQFHANVTTTDGSGRLVIEPATIEGL